MTATRDSRRDRFALNAAVAAALFIGICLRLFLNAHRPFWSDEAFTGALALRPTFGALAADMLIDINGPVYYSAIWLWEKVAGAGNLALRVPSLVFSIAAPVLLLWKGHPDKEVRATWAALVALSLPLIEHASDARYYSLVVLLASAQAIAFARMVRRPAIRIACVWSGLSATLILTHYFTLPLIGGQVAVYLALHKRRAIATWPAALPFLVPPLWMVPNLRAVAGLITGAWQPLLKLSDFPQIPDALFGFGAAVSTVVLAVALGLVLRQRPWTEDDRALAAGCLAALLACGGVFVLGIFARSFVPRYLLAYIPAVLGGVALLVRRTAFPPAAVIGAFALLSLAPLAKRDERIARDMRWQLSWEAASRDLAASGVRTVVLYWNSTVRGSDPLTLRHLGFFFNRANLPIRVVPGPDGQSESPSLEEVASHAGGTGGRLGILYVLASTQSLPRDLGGPRFTCRRYGLFMQRITLACVERPPNGGTAPW